MKGKLKGLLLALFNLLVLSVIARWPTWWVGLPMIAVWVVLIVFLCRLKNETEARRPERLVLLILSAASGLLIFLLLEWIWLRRLMLILTSLFPYLILASEEAKQFKLSYEQKPWRRIDVMVYTFSLYAIFTFLFSLRTLFSGLPFWLPSFFGCLFAAGVAALVWRLYYDQPLPFFFFWSLIVGIVMWELLTIIGFLPLGYLTLGGLATWLWYVLQLLVRFRLSPRGIEWRRQILFLISNVVLLFIFLWFFVRWI
ncbi:MAG TPA: hypothetical protein VJB37_02820 [Patescibacteria group bacterium]|nr:hypothetical protein [Patescibacteria group bacterium]